MSDYSAFDHFLEGCQVIGFDWHFIYINDAACNHVRRSKEELLGKNLLDVAPGFKTTEIYGAIKSCMEERIGFQREYGFIFPDGTKGWFDSKILPIPEGVLILSVDVTEIKQILLRLEEQNKGLTLQNEEKERRAAELVFANEETVHHLQNIQALSTIDQAIASNLDLELTLKLVLEQVKSQLNVDAAAVLLFNPHTQVLEFAATTGFRSKEIESLRLHLGEGLGGRAVLERKTVYATNLRKNHAQFVDVPIIANEGFETFFAIPLIAKGQVNGVMEVFQRESFTPDENWLKFLKVLSEQTAIALDNANLFTELELSNAQLIMAYETTIEGWSHALDLRDKETEGHTQRVTEMTLKLARAAGITEEKLIHVRRGALLHDIGKMGVPDHILLKPGKLTDEEWAVMCKHPIFAFELLSPITFLHPALDIPYCHHEKWDGSGYPRGLKGEQIPLEARLFSIVDLWDALLSDRPYRKGWSKKKVIEHIKSLSGTHFDPKAVELFLKVMNEDTKDTGKKKLHRNSKNPV